MSQRTVTSCDVCGHDVPEKDGGLLGSVILERHRGRGVDVGSPHRVVADICTDECLVKWAQAYEQGEPIGEVV